MTLQKILVLETCRKSSLGHSKCFCRLMQTNHAMPVVTFINVSEVVLCWLCVIANRIASTPRDVVNAMVKYRLRHHVSLQTNWDWNYISVTYVFYKAGWRLFVTHKKLSELWLMKSKPLLIQLQTDRSNKKTVHMNRLSNGYLTCTAYGSGVPNRIRNKIAWMRM